MLAELFKSFGSVSLSLTSNNTVVGRVTLLTKNEDDHLVFYEFFEKKGVLPVIVRRSQKSQALTYLGEAGTRVLEWLVLEGDESLKEEFKIYRRVFPTGQKCKHMKTKRLEAYSQWLELQLLRVQAS